MDIRKLIETYKIESALAFDSIAMGSMEYFYEMIVEAYESEAKVFACGNGGNVASVHNFVLDLNMHPFVSEDKSRMSVRRNKFHAVNLCADPAAITGMVNDIGFDNIFAEQLRYQARENDILFAMSGSGNSKNIIAALKMARVIGMKNVLITRGENTEAETYSDLILRVRGVSVFPGNTGGNNNNFHYEDCVSKVSHIVVGLLKKYVQDAN